jgi:hypothetical protein
VKRRRIDMNGGGKLFLMAAVILLGISGIVFASKDNQIFSKETITADKVRDRITREYPYKSYSNWPSYAGMRPGKAPHGPFHRIFINPIIKDALPLENKTVPNGGIVVKEAYDTDKELSTIAVMVKVKDYDPENGDWFYLDLDPKYKILFSGKEAVCIKCHKAYKNNDYLIVHKLDKK